MAITEHDHRTKTRYLEVKKSVAFGAVTSDKKGDIGPTNGYQWPERIDAIYGLPLNMIIRWVIISMIIRWKFILIIF